MRRLLTVRLVAFDLRRAYRLNPAATLRPEPFGALAYHFGTRRLSFLKSRTLLKVVEQLEAHSTARAACDVAGIREAEMPLHEAALERDHVCAAPLDALAGGRDRRQWRYRVRDQPVRNGVAPYRGKSARLVSRRRLNR